MKELKTVITLVLLVTGNISFANGQRGKSELAFDVCVAFTDAAFNESGDGQVGLSMGDGVGGVGLILPIGTVPEDGSGDPTCNAYDSSRIGSFYTRGVIIAGLPRAASDDFGYMDWHFKIDGVGAFNTTGPINNGALGSTYPHTIIGGTGRYRGINGELTTLVLAPGGFQIRVFLRGKLE